MGSSKSSQKIQEFILNKLEKHPKDIVRIAMSKFTMTRPGVHRHLKKLIIEGKILKSGGTRDAQYFIATKKRRYWKFKSNDNLDENLIWKDTIAPYLQGAPKNIYDICEYGISEMLNNAIDHSEGKNITVGYERKSNNLNVQIFDDGIGIFEKIRKHFNLEDHREAIFELSKGKLTTDPSNHSGEGIFFTSRAFDEFSILSRDLFYRVDTGKEDWFLDMVDDKKTGTLITLKISFKTKRNLMKLFNEYSSETDDVPRFSKTRNVIKLALREGETVISRSQAKRILHGLEKFSTVIFDYKGVTSIGQAYADQVYRIFQEKYPNIQLVDGNTNENIQYMIDRAKVRK